MIKTFFRFALIAIICLSLPSKLLSQDFCNEENSASSEVVVEDSSHHEHSCIGVCDCHCHPGHIDFAFLPNSFAVQFVKFENFNSSSKALFSVQINSLKRPPKLVS